ncbi:TIGR00366 family protein [Halomicroarcula limicola]|uniref:TIGR00366 family protein n=1 Tax=Haloarcula limicola TaxID=1429915 RepID=A0A8J7YG38_9EURY|nr:TIGR00366 family protein [Halomicroarcula limicola]MBV0925853.1 TIGR00366 family protein [Halomicroarcula limicola]
MSSDEQSQIEGTLLQRTGARLSERVERWMPSPFIFAILLTYIVFIIGILVEGAGPVQMVQYWFDGFWVLLSFTMQAVLILVTGFVLAYHPFIQNQIKRLLSIPSTARQGLLLVSLIAMVTAWFHWGLGLIVGALLAREMGRQANERGLNIHYPLLCVAGYMGLALTWNMGLSGASVLLMNTPGNIFIEQGIIDQLVPVTETIFHPYMVSLLVISIAYSMVVLYFLSPPDSQSEGITEFLPESELTEANVRAGETTATDGSGEEGPEKDRVGDDAPDSPTPSDKMNNSRLIGGVIAVTGVVFAIYTFATRGLNALNLNTVNFAFLFIGFALFTSPQAYEERFAEAIDSTGDIILQFPFYAGIIGMTQNSGLAETIAESIVSFAGPETYPAAVVIISALVNTFVPSGGGEWTVIGPIVVPAAQDLGVPLGQTLVAYTFGASLADLVQPFWALPLLAITDMRARDIFGYAIMMLLLMLPFVLIAVIVIPYAGGFWTSIVPF